MDLSDSEISGLKEFATNNFSVLTGAPLNVSENVYVLDAETIDDAFQQVFKEGVGAFRFQNVQDKFRKIAAKFAKRAARRGGEHLGLPEEILRNAWFHKIFSELTTIVPMRHLARKLSKQHQGKLLAVEMKGDAFQALNSWRQNDLEPLFLAYELYRLKAPVFLYSDRIRAESISISISERWLKHKHPHFYRSRDFSSILVANAMRSSDYAAERHGIVKFHGPKLTTSLGRSIRNPYANTVSLDFSSGPKFGALQSYTIDDQQLSLEAGFVKLVGPVTKNVASWYQSALKDRPVENAHVADHTSLEGSLLAGEIVKKGGKINLWPHSANVVQIDLHNPDNLRSVTVAVNSTAAHWRRKVGDEKVILDPKSILASSSPAPGFDETKPLHIILFAGAHALRRTPIVNYETHCRTWSTVLTALQRSDHLLSIKHKSIWENRDWIAMRSSGAKPLKFSRKKAMEINYSNMIFVSISATSTAILEGISRGIPGMVVRDQPINETPNYDPDYIPRLKSSEFSEFLSKLNSRIAWEELRDQQLTWFENETSTKQA
ncbi:MAG: hypothetical protein ABJN14_01100 [Paracoccaceae bacterium]